MSWLNALRRALGRPERRPARRPARAGLRLEQLETRLVPYSASGNAWPAPQLVTISFVPDGTVLGSDGTNPITSNLQATLTARFGSAAAWQNIVLRAAQVWAQQTNLNFEVVADDGSQLGSGAYQQGDPSKGDIRVGGYNFGNSNLATAYMPPPVNNFSIAGDFMFNTGQAFNSGYTYDLFTVACHEFGHVLGLYHSNVISAAMYSAYGGVKNNLVTDDVNGIRSIYGGARAADAYEGGGGNNSFATATDLGAKTSGATQSVVADITTTTDADFFTFLAPAGGGTLNLSVQSDGLSLLSQAYTVYNASMVAVASGAATGAYGTTLSHALTLTAGARYYVKVNAAATNAFGTGKYALNLGFDVAAPVAPSPSTQLLNGEVPSGGGGMPTEEGAAFLVNATTDGVQQTSSGPGRAVAIDQMGNFVATWASQGQDGSGWGVYARRFAADGTPLGDEFLVNQTTDGDQVAPAVATDVVGNFLVVWQGGTGVYARRFAADGTPLGDEFLVNETAAAAESSPAVAVSRAGFFVVTWTGADGDGAGVYARRYGADGTPVGGEFLVNTTTAGDQRGAGVAVSDGGHVVITWASQGQDGGGWGVYGQRYGVDGNAAGGEFQVNTSTAGDQEHASVGMAQDGSFVVTWVSHDPGANGSGVYAQRFDASGQQAGEEFRVNTAAVVEGPEPSGGPSLSPEVRHASVAMDGKGGFVVTWSSNGQDGDGWGVYAQQYRASGAAAGGPFLVNNDATAGDQHSASSAMNVLGRMVVVWSGAGAGVASGVFAQRYVITEYSDQQALAVSHSFDPEGHCDDHDSHGCGCGDCGAVVAAAAGAVVASPESASVEPPDGPHGAAPGSLALWGSPQAQGLLAQFVTLLTGGWGQSHNLFGSSEEGTPPEAGTPDGPFALTSFDAPPAEAVAPAGAGADSEGEASAVEVAVTDAVFAG